ncbi:cytochrome c biogenesis protein ResB [Pseudonocardia xinjiangensis]|uniref:Cytochrome c biogenesis protein ResB n=1 Tax=Pseudonocardia xinjiangensis TaxID=75289 RepID=A0ABX1RRS3_9PSEU|nr:cytochrome c biogenesis protein ResB [Pseudonocardia xinjiangensis]NMH82319.1 cytochrome c biogenesis protein ResB [Pseudonocardia xinjiangensis]
MASTELATRPPESGDPRPTGGRLAIPRNAWRALTSMRTALILLFLLALAAMPGALLPQRSLNQQLVDQYFTDHPSIAPLLSRLGFFDVFAAPWFAAIYLLLMISLVGCVLPRTIEHAKTMRAAPVATPRNLGRLPHHGSATLDVGPEEAAERVRHRLRGWRKVETATGSGRTISAEKGYLREFGNLLFHLSLIGLLVGFGAGKLYGYGGQVIVLADGGQFCNTGILGYDSFQAGLRVDGTNLQPFCVRVNDFEASYLPDGQPESYHASIGYQTTDDLNAGRVDQWRPYPLEVNSPLRLDGSRVYLINHGYAPRFTVTFPDGQKRTGEIQWQPVDATTYLSQGATKFEPPGVTDEEKRRTSQLAITGLLAPTSSGGQVVTSVFPALRDPEVAVDVLRGDLGLDDGRGQSIFEVDQSKIDSGQLKQVARANLVPGQSITLDDGTIVTFDDVRQWVALQISHDPGQDTVLVFAVLMLIGLGLSLSIRRRRFWARLTPTADGTRTVVEIGGLARTDRAGYGEEFDRLRADLLDAPHTGAEVDGSGADGPNTAAKDG